MKQRTFFTRHLVLISLLFASSFLFLSGCSEESQQTSSVGDRISPTYGTGFSKLSYCSNSSSISYSTSYTISGTAKYEARQPFFTGGGGLGGAGTAQPIRYAEVRVTDSSGNIAQCAETDGSGNFSFSLPQSGSNTPSLSMPELTTAMLKYLSSMLPKKIIFML